MKPDFNEAFIHQFPRRTVMPAEACSELGIASGRRRRALWIARWLRATRRWFIDDDQRATS